MEERPRPWRPLSPGQREAAQAVSGFPAGRMLSVPSGAAPLNGLCPLPLPPAGAGNGFPVGGDGQPRYRRKECLLLMTRRKNQGGTAEYTGGCTAAGFVPYLWGRAWLRPFWGTESFLLSCLFPAPAGIPAGALAALSADGPTPTHGERTAALCARGDGILRGGSPGRAGSPDGRALWMGRPVRAP